MLLLPNNWGHYNVELHLCIYTHICSICSVLFLHFSYPISLISLETTHRTHCDEGSPTLFLIPLSAPASSSRFTVFLWFRAAATWRAVSPTCGEHHHLLQMFRPTAVFFLKEVIWMGCCEMGSFNGWHSYWLDGHRVKNNSYGNCAARSRTNSLLEELTWFFSATEQNAPRRIFTITVWLYRAAMCKHESPAWNKTALSWKPLESRSKNESESTIVYSVYTVNCYYRYRFITISYSVATTNYSVSTMN